MAQFTLIGNIWSMYIWRVIVLQMKNPNGILMFLLNASNYSICFCNVVQSSCIFSSFFPCSFLLNPPGYFQIQWFWNYTFTYSIILDNDFFYPIYHIFGFPIVFFSSIICLILLKIGSVSFAFSGKILKHFSVYFFKLIMFPYSICLNHSPWSSPIHITIWSVSSMSFS